MSKEKLSTEICQKCSNPRGAHKTNCPVFVEDLAAVKEEYQNYAESKEKISKAVEKESQDLAPGTLEEQLKEIDPNPKNKIEEVIAKDNQDLTPGTFEEQIKEIELKFKQATDNSDDNSKPNFEFKEKKEQHVHNIFNEAKMALLIALAEYEDFLHDIQYIEKNQEKEALSNEQAEKLKVFQDRYRVFMSKMNKYNEKISVCNIYDESDKKPLERMKDEINEMAREIKVFIMEVKSN
ncbi:MAG: hypothetical protein Q8P20_03450 [bacterium]|nr:hypothetical protein [bacterium]